jgi:predicted enzyme related to lactoylglutathione lyase
MGHPVVHFEVIGKDGAKLASFFSELFGWDIDPSNPLGYGLVAREQNSTKTASASAAASARPSRAPTGS